MERYRVLLLTYEKYIEENEHVVLVLANAPDCMNMRFTEHCVAQEHRLQERRLFLDDADRI